MGDITKQIEEMTELISANTAAPMTNAPSTNAPSTNAPGTDPPSTDVPSTESPSTAAPKTDAPSTDAPSTEAPATDAPDELAEIKAEMIELRKKIAEKDKPKTDAPGTSAPSTDAPIGDEDFLGDIDLDELTRSKDDLNKLLNSVLKKGMEMARSDMRLGDEKVLRAVPEMTKKNIEIVTTLKEASEVFYKDNKDLIPFKKVVAVVFEEESAKDPGKKYGEVLKDVGPEVRKRLDLQKKATEPKDKDNKHPKLPRKKSQPRQQQNKPEPNSLNSQIDDMNEALNS